MNNELLDMMQQDAASATVPQDKLDKLRKCVQDMRVLDVQITDLESQATELNKKLYAIRSKELVDLFDETGVNHIGLPAEGNYPAYDVELKQIVRANIGTAVDPKVEDYSAAIKYITATEPDMLKSVYTIAFGKGEDKKRKAFEVLLRKAKVDYSSTFGVPHQTLTAWVKQQLNNKKHVPLKLINATVERIATVIKPRAARAK
jgi:hypothetical protein